MTDWSVVVIVEETLPYLAHVRIDEFYLYPESCALAFKLGRSRIKEIFDEYVSYPSVSCPPISYGHVACLGCEIVFPKDSEPYAKPAFASLDDGIRTLERDVDFKDNPLFNHYLKMNEYLKGAFPDEKIAFSGFGGEGPITSAGLLRGQGFLRTSIGNPRRLNVS